MSKQYFLKYGSDLNQETLIVIFTEKFGFEFVLHESSYFGLYAKGKATFCEQLKILDNLLPDDDKYVETSNHLTILSFSFIDSSNATNKKNYELIKSQMKSIDGVEFIDENICD